MATTRNDKAMYVVLVAAIVAGLATTLLGVTAAGEAHNYRQTVVALVPLVVRAPPRRPGDGRRRPASRCTCSSAMLLFALWPFTRLVHAFTAPVGYLFRPYVVYRRRRTAGAVPSSSRGRRGWDRAGSPPAERGGRYRA